ncbi:hypothetical protein GIB67_038111 [Kingdonia uniflora]|uniref:Uncharacterized protein n=1 Tax=Kingdonia uniflora TaxID=39325 RepID=A0A7J7P7X7_9MAGN|nr:hypothetical protein GIB67_038111 [Kingdonia uniflora]
MLIFTADNVKKWWLWGYWTSPMMYVQNALVVNEFLGKSWSRVLLNSVETLGVRVLKSRRLFAKAHWELARLPREFRFEDLKTVTNDFPDKLGSGESGYRLQGNELNDCYLGRSGNILFAYLDIVVK